MIVFELLILVYMLLELLHVETVVNPEKNTAKMLKCYGCEEGGEMHMSLNTRLGNREKFKI